MTYDNVPEVEDLALASGLTTRRISMRNAHSAALSELLVGKDLSWVT